MKVQFSNFALLGGLTTKFDKILLRLSSVVFLFLVTFGGHLKLFALCHPANALVQRRALLSSALLASFLNLDTSGAATANLQST